MAEPADETADQARVNEAPNVDPQDRVDPQDPGPASSQDAPQGDEASQPNAGGDQSPGEGKPNLNAKDIEKLLDQASESLEQAAGEEVSVDAQAKPFTLGEITPEAEAEGRQPMDLLGEVEMDLRIELGRTQMRLEEVLQLRGGSVVALDKLAGDPVDIFVNGRLIARGEVLVMNDNFCIRVTELVRAEEAALKRQQECPMRSIHLSLFALLVAIAMTASLFGQENSSQILARGQVASLTVDAQERPARGGFPSFAPNGRQEGSKEQGAADGSTRGGLAGPAITVTSSLVVVLALFAGLVWITRKFGARNLRHGGIPGEVLQGLGSAPVDARTTITMVRLGNRILVMAQTPTGVHPLSEITDPDEVRNLSAACRGDSKRAFASALSSIEKEKPQPGYIGTGQEPSTPRARGRLFTTA